MPNRVVLPHSLEKPMRDENINKQGKMKRIVLDKSFLEGKNSAYIAELCEKADLFMLETLFYEIITHAEK